MANEQLSRALGHLGRTLARRDRCEVGDRELLEGFLAGGAGDAFEALIQRHGPMVLAVCRRVLGDHHHAEDAFQATFLILLRKAGSIGRPERLGNWLYGVAYRTALQARGGLMRQCAREVPLTEEVAAEPDTELLRQEVQRILDEELARLPEKYRAPLVLHYLQGRTKQETARQLGWPEGTVSIRLARARDLLRRRLTNRGLALPAAALAALLSRATASIAVPPLLSALTVHRVGLAGGISARAAVLAQGVLRAMFLARLKTAAAVLVVCLGASAAGVLGRQAVAAPESGPPAAHRLAAGARAAGAGERGSRSEKGRDAPGNGEAEQPDVLFPFGHPPSIPNFCGEGRLGALLRYPSSTLVEQLRLPPGYGFVLEHVPADSPAGKAGLKARDILLELDGQKVPSHLQRFGEQLSKFETDTPITAEVLRKGEKIIVRGLVLPAPPPLTPRPMGPGAGLGLVPRLHAEDPAASGHPIPSPLLGRGVLPASGGGLLTPGDAGPDTVIFRDKGRFVIQHRDGLVAILLGGTLAGGKATVQEILVQNGARLQTYRSVAEVPEEYRRRVNELLEKSWKEVGAEE
jgi:RNA polymerase sigma factor (sigma-70 family)